MFMAFAWIPKSGVPAALGGLTLAKAQELGITEYEDYGRAMLTTAVLSVVILAPLGGIMINTLGPRWLEYDGTDPELLSKSSKIIPLNKADAGVPTC